MAISMHLRVKIQYHTEGYIIIIIYISEACNLQYQYMIICNWGAWCMDPGVCVCGGGGEMWKYFIAIEGRWKDFIRTLLP